MISISNLIRKDRTANQDKTGWKIGRGSKGDYRLVQIRIPKDAKRVTGEDNKSRCDKAEVINIFDINTLTNRIKKKRKLGKNILYHEINEFEVNYSQEYNKAYSALSQNIVGDELEYVVGEMIEVDDFDNSKKSCSTGIHFFFSQKELFDYFKNNVILETVKKRKLQQYPMRKKKIEKMLNYKMKRDNSVSKNNYQMPRR